MDPNPATERFAAWLRTPEGEAHLDEGALLVAAHARPGLDVAVWLARLDELAHSVANATSAPALAHALFVEHGFAGNTDDYDDPRNSMLPDVLDRRLGIPITLSVLMIEIGRRRGLALHGVGMPGHFLVGTRDRDVFVDPFHAGAVLDAAGCRDRLAALHGHSAGWDPRYLEPVGSRAILLRMLNNLERAYGGRRDANGVWVARLRLLFPELPSAERRRTANVLGALGAFAEGAAALEAMVGVLEGDAAVEVAAEATALRARAN